MIIYSVTISLDESIEADWLVWMRDKHIRDVMATGYFLGWSFHKLLEPIPEPGTSTYNIQYECATLVQLEAYQKNKAPALQQAHNDRYRDQFIAFRTILDRF